MDRARTLLLALALPAALVLAAGAAWAEGDAQDFRQNCAACHTIGGGRLVGPDLQGATERRTKDWLVRFILDPGGVVQSGDPYAVRLLEEARGVIMPAVPGMTQERARSLVDLIEVESAKETSQFASTGVSDRPFTATDVERGRQIFLGLAPLQGGAGACISCHSAGDAGALGGGRLGPDLGDAFARLGGRKTLGAWLMAPPTPTMKPNFATRPLDPEQEILPLLAFLQDASQSHAAPNTTAQRLTYVFLATGLAGLLLVLADRVWGRRFRGVRARLLKESA